jgi:dTDP-4-amino-4,6-dideoxygalactose transaminase
MIAEKNKAIYVTMPSLPPLEEYNELLQGVWERGILTHNGPLVQQFEKEFNAWSGIKNSVAVSNGTIAIQMAIRALKLKGEIITTPFTWVATVSAILWEYCTPVFVDIDPNTLNMDPAQIEAKITNKTCAIMPVHVFGNACECDMIEAIAAKHKLKVIYDAAHAVGVTYKGKPLLEAGDISVTSFHATKLLNTAEGGGCITRDLELFEHLKRIRFFGHNDAKDVVQDGFNGKLTEVHAALGLANLKYIDEVAADRRRKYAIYKELLQDDRLRFQQINNNACNYSYFPVIFDSEKTLLRIEKVLNEQAIFPRRYFYPSVNTYKEIVPYSAMPNSEDISSRILCLPLYWKLPVDKMEEIAETILKNL